MQELNPILSQQEDQEASFDLRKFLERFLHYWPWFLATVAMALLLAFLYLRYATPVYKTSATVMVQDDKKGATLADGDLMEQLGLGGKSNVDNEVEIYKSRTLMERVVRDLQLYTHFYTEGRVKTTEVYNAKHFNFQFLSFLPDSVKKTASYTLSSRPEGFELKGPKASFKGAWGGMVKLPMGEVLISKNPSVSFSEKEFTILIAPFDETVSELMDKLKVAAPNKMVSTIDLAYETTVPEKGEAVVNKLIDEYMNANVDDKNRIADSTMNFIDGRLEIVFKELSGIEKDIEQFKSENNLTDISSQAQLLLSNTSDYAKQIAEQEVQLNIVNSLQQYIFEKGNSKRVVPQALLIENNGAFTSLLERYNTLQLERERGLMSMSENNPFVVNLDQQLDNLREDIHGNIASYKRQINITLNELRSKTGSLTSQIRTVPKKERIYVDFARQQGIKQELYLFLLKKREETAISKSSTIANARIVDIAKTGVLPVKPKKPLIYLSAFLLGLILPGAVIYVKELLNTRIVNKEDITSRTGAAIIGEIGHKEGGENVVVKPGARSAVAEQFRALRTNVAFLLPAHEKTVLLTSSMSGEGKSFVALNLAATLALSGKKVVIMELDLRKPKISQALGINSTKGFSSYAIGESEINEIILPSGEQDNFWVIPAGPIPPNPAELIMLPRIAHLFDELKKHFDYIIMDTAPLGLVTDAQLLAGYADLTLFLVRQGYTFKPQISQIQQVYLQKKLPKLSLVVNDVNAVKGYGYGYGGYGYGYGYGYGEYGNGYFEEGKKKKSLLETIRQRFLNGK